MTAAGIVAFGTAIALFGFWAALVVLLRRPDCDWASMLLVLCIGFGSALSFVDAGLR